ncbi:MAG TPA: hypothetical protein VEB19_09105, partial [Gemmatimonadaceae bacterium]|nr:hypothetical protein [Gemmatimonadaceae bacterium]
EFGRDLYKAVSSMPESAATSAFTAVMQRMSTPSKPAAAIPETPAGATKAIPQTRVNRATGASGEKVVPQPVAASSVRGRSGMWGAIAFAGIAILGWSSYKLLGSQDTQEVSGGQAVPQSQPAAQPTVPTVNWGLELERIDPLAGDLNASVARDALNRLALLDSAAMNADSVTRLRFRYLRSKALINSGDYKSGCDSLYNLEGQLSRSETLRRAGATLIGTCRDQ